MKEQGNELSDSVFGNANSPRSTKTLNAEANKLRIAGMIPFSTVDWPGKIVATLFLQGCPWRCPYCHNASILDPRVPGTMEWDQVRQLLVRRRGLLDGIVFSGGEPLMQGGVGPDVNPLEATLSEVHERGFDTGIHTSGVYPNRLKNLVNKGLVNWVALDVKAVPKDYSYATGMLTSNQNIPVAVQKVEQSIAVLADCAQLDWEARLTLWPPLAGGRNPGDLVHSEHGKEGDTSASSEQLIDYACEVAQWAYEKGARSFALQRYRVPPWAQKESNSDAEQITNPGAAWEDAHAQAALEQIGFDHVTCR